MPPERTLRWTKSAPKQAGWYFVQTDIDGALEPRWIQQVHDRDGVLVVMLDTPDGPEPWPIDGYTHWLWWPQPVQFPVSKPASRRKK